PPTDSYPPALHDALPISTAVAGGSFDGPRFSAKNWVFAYFPQLRILVNFPREPSGVQKGNIFLYYPEDVPGGAYFTFALIEAKLDRKSTRLNSSHVSISY